MNSIFIFHDIRPFLLKCAWKKSLLVARHLSSVILCCRVDLWIALELICVRRWVEHSEMGQRSTDRLYCMFFSLKLKIISASLQLEPFSAPLWSVMSAAAVHLHCVLSSPMSPREKIHSVEKCWIMMINMLQGILSKAQQSKKLFNNINECTLIMFVCCHACMHMNALSLLFQFSSWRLLLGERETPIKHHYRPRYCRANETE